MARRRRWTDQQLTDAVAASTSYRQVCLALGLVPGDYGYLRAHVERLGLNGAHLLLAVSSPRPRHCTDAQLACAVDAERTIAGVLRRLGRRSNGGNHRWLERQIRRLGLDTSHFVGRSWARGHEFGARRAALAGLPAQRTAGTPRAVAGQGRCEECGLHHWHGEPLPLARVATRVLCPNCHALATA